jgi:hypothetical protein
MCSKARDEATACSEARSWTSRGGGTDGRRWQHDSFQGMLNF